MIGNENLRELTIYELVTYYGGSVHIVLRDGKLVVVVVTEKANETTLLPISQSQSE